MYCVQVIIHSMQLNISNASCMTYCPWRNKSSSSHLYFGSAPWHSGDVAHDVFGCHSLPCSALSTEKQKDLSTCFLIHVMWASKSNSNPPDALTNGLWHLLRCQEVMQTCVVVWYFKLSEFGVSKILSAWFILLTRDSLRDTFNWLFISLCFPGPIGCYVRCILLINQSNASCMYCV